MEANVRALKRNIREAKEAIKDVANKGLIAVNIMCASKKNYGRFVEASVEAGVDMIISGAVPTALPGLVKEQQGQDCSYCFLG